MQLTGTILEEGKATLLDEGTRAVATDSQEPHLREL